MIEISIIGNGNVAWHLAQVYDRCDTVSVNQIYGRDLAKLNDFKSYGSVTNNLSTLNPVDFILIAVSDDHIQEVASQLPINRGVVLHTSGSKSLHILNKHTVYGVFYPLQTFSRGIEVDFKKIPICIEANNDLVLKKIKTLAKAISLKVELLNSDARKQLHLAAVMANNFTNHLLMQVKELCSAHQLDFNLIKPLLEETVDKLFKSNNLDTQTGPAKRGDYQVINQHLDQLEFSKQKELYKALTNSILTTYGKEKL